MENRLSRAPTLPSAGAVAFACLLFAAPPQMARAHGDAAWIMQDPGYRTANGSHCCGPTDCERVPDGEVVEMAPGQWVVRSTRQVLNQSDKGVYPSKQGSFWWCRRGARVVCLFYDAGGY